MNQKRNLLAKAIQRTVPTHKDPRTRAQHESCNNYILFSRRNSM